MAAISSPDVAAKLNMSLDALIEVSKKTEGKQRGGPSSRKGSFSGRNSKFQRDGKPKRFLRPRGNAPNRAGRGEFLSAPTRGSWKKQLGVRPTNNVDNRQRNSTRGTKFRPTSMFLRSLRATTRKGITDRLKDDDTSADRDDEDIEMLSEGEIEPSRRRQGPPNRRNFIAKRRASNPGGRRRLVLRNRISDPGATNAPTGPLDNRMLLVEGLYHTILKTELQELFTSIGPVLKCWIDYDRTDRSLGTGGVIFRHEDDAAAAYEEFNGRLLDGNPLRLYWRDELLEDVGAD